MKLYGCKGCGSTVVEALLDLAGVRYDSDVFGFDDAAGWDRVRAVNPLGQVPLLVLDDGTAISESAGIALWIANAYPDAALLPVDAAARALLYRWTVHFATNVYVPVVIGDFPERWVDGDAARASLKAHALQRSKDAWSMFEERVAPSPYLLGAGPSVLDVYVAMLSHWRPGRAWLTEHCPKVIASTDVTTAHPVIAAVWARNFEG